MALVQALSNLTTTENGDLAHTTTKDARLDMFYGMMDTVDRNTARKLTEAAWKVHPLDTIKLIFYILDVRQGKSCNQPALFALQWLLDNGHETVVEKNLEYVATFGSYKDYAKLLQILRSNDDEMLEITVLNQLNKKNKNKTRNPPLASTERHKVTHQKSKIDAYHDKIRQHNNPKVHNMTIIIANLFARQLKADRASLEDKKSLSLAAKWVPTKGTALDQETGLHDAIACAVWKEENSSLGGKTSKTLSSKKRRQLMQNHLRREYLTPLRKALNIVESRLSSKQVELINYSHVPSLSMKRNAKTFEKCDKDRFTKFMQEKAVQVKGGVLKPHQLVGPLISSTHARKLKKWSHLEQQVNEAQWTDLVKQIKDQGTLKDALAIVDVSGSMFAVLNPKISPIEVSISLGLLISEVAQPPWKNVVMTFSAEPEFIKFDQDSESDLASKVKKIENMPWGMNTAFDEVFHLILSRAKEHKVEAKDMVKQIFVLSDMQFDSADNRNVYKTSHERIKEAYCRAGYDMPQIVYWNLANSSTTACPIQKDERGTALVSGFSSNMLKLFLQGDLTEDNADNVDTSIEKQESEEKKKMSPMEIMRTAIDHERYDVLSL